ncbi:MAG TPA: 4Fe-4S dicluster domain-containing protein [Candidatus Deferrimicrobium sp.]|nr:4Fe-4S dicluster domain-containing protein [Candidatus Deferrimicrobium sp.]
MTEAKLKVETDYYEIVRQKLKVGPIAAPKHEKVYELMKVFWDEDTIKLLSHFPNAGQEISVDELAEKSGLEQKEIKKILKKAVERRTLAKIGAKSYTLHPLLPGVFEPYFISRKDTEENLKKAAKIYRYMIKNANEFEINQDFQLLNPILPFEATEKLIIIDETVDTKSKVLPFEVVEEMINKNEYFSVTPCQCRLVAKLSGEPCEIAADDLGCLQVGPSAQAIVSLGFGRALTKEEAIEFLKKTEKAGLIHNAEIESGDHGFICNCCSCHCGVVSSRKNFQLNIQKPSNYKPQHNPEICVKCKICVKKCPMEAIFYQEADDKIVINLDLCIGCGVCAANCKKNALLMKKVSNEIPDKEHKFGNKTFQEIVRELLL